MINGACRQYQILRASLGDVNNVKLLAAGHWLFNVEDEEEHPSCYPKAKEMEQFVV
jgi:hypothetical protein